MGEPLDFKSDLFSFGILTYQLLCGAHPFGDTNNKLQLMQRIISHPPTAPGKHNPDLPPEINALLGQLLSKDPQKRPDNTHWVAAQLEKLSHVQLANDFASDDTQALIPNGSAANHSYLKNTEINSATRTQEHPTFETRFIPVNTATKKSRWLPIKNYLAENKISVGVGLFSALILAALAVWQLQPKPPKYVAVIPPKLTAEGMQESQQELVKGAVYDAIQQSVIQLDGYYLIPRSEIADVNGDIDTIQIATAADELITTDLKCKIEMCSITLTRLVPDNEKTKSRFRVADVKTVDVLTDRYTSVADTVQRNFGLLYSEKLVYMTKVFNEDQYAKFLQIAQELRVNGASMMLLSNLESLQNTVKHLPATQTLYREVALDLFHETKDSIILERINDYLSNDADNDEGEQFLDNLYRLQIAKGEFDAAKITIKKLGEKNTSHSAIHEMEAYMMMAKNDYTSAIEYYKKALNSKRTANNLINLSNAYWYAGQNASAKKYLTEALTLSPTQYKANSILGLIELIEGNIEQAINRLEKALSQKPDDIGNLSNLGLSYLLINRYTDAESLFKKSHELAPQFHTLLLNKGDAENLSGNVNQSRITYLQVIDRIEKDTLTAENLRSISQAYAHLDRKPEALKALRELEKIDPQNIETIYTAALVHTLTGNTASAIFNIDLALANGMDKLWFGFAWYNLLCNEKGFQELMQKHGETDRCSPQQ
jgi:tetratricopeptide (TPR) repeat protein